MTMNEAGAEITLRPFQRSDIGPLGVLFRASRVSMQLFDEPYTAAEHMGYIAGLSVGCTITVAERSGKPLGFLSHARKPGQKMGLVSHLFVHPDHQGQSIGAQLLDDALKRFPAPLHLWCFEANKLARALYESRGFIAIERTDGAGNDENLPDVHYIWRT